MSLLSIYAYPHLGPYSEGQEYLQDASVTAEKTVPFDLFFPNDGDAPQWQLVTRLEEAAPPDSQIPNAAVLNTVSEKGPHTLEVYDTRNQGNNHSHLRRKMLIPD